MNITTMWVKKPKQIKGRDHLAVQAPCINMYAQMLPGITNVTDRARYYSFYPWIVRALQKAGHIYNDTFIDLFRKADCLFTLIAHQHANVSGGDSAIHSGATTGTVNLSKQILKIKEGHSVRLSEYAHLGETGQPYFKNKLGGLGQYYLGVFKELDVMRGSIASGIQNTEEIGLLVAEKFAQGADHDLFIKTLEEDIVTIKRLNELSDFCSCQIANNPSEQKILCDIFFVKDDFYDRAMLERRHTLQTILYVADSLSEVGEEIDINLFRGCIYCGSLPDGSKIEVPEKLQTTIQRWSIYQRNELFSLCLQGLFFVLLEAYDESGKKFSSTQEICQWYLNSDEVIDATPFDVKGTTFKEAKDIFSKELPPFTSWLDNNHEVQAAFEIEFLCKQEKSSVNRVYILQACFNIIAALCTREDYVNGYGDFVFNKKNYLEYYNINLHSFDHHAENTWPEMIFSDWLIWVFSNWGIEAHLKVALRKLRGRLQSTFRIKPSDSGYEVIETPSAVFTNPRFKQALQLLIDVGALEKKDGIIVTSELGKSLKDIKDD